MEIYFNLKSISTRKSFPRLPGGDFGDDPNQNFSRKNKKMHADNKRNFY